MTWDDVVGLASEFPGVESSTSYGTPAMKVKGKLLTRLRPEDDSLVILGVAAEERDMLIEVDPCAFHTTPHYHNYPTVLLRLAAVDPETVRVLLGRRWRSIAPRRAVKLLDQSRRPFAGTRD